MSPHSLPQLMDVLLRLSKLEPAQLQELMRQLPDPQASAREMVRRGWITADQFSALFPGPEPQHPTARETMLGSAHDANPPETDCDWSLNDWNLTRIDDAPKAEVPPTKGARTRPGRADVATATEPEWVEATDVPVAAGRSTARRQESDPDRVVKQWLGRAITGLLMGIVFLGSVVAGLPMFVATAAVVPAAHPESRQASANEPARSVDVPPVPHDVPMSNAKEPVDPPPGIGQKAPPPAPVVVPPPAPVVVPPVAPKAPAWAASAKPRPKGSLYDRIRQIVQENRTVETDRVGVGDVAFQVVPDDGSILVGMEVTYGTFINHQIIKSVRPIFQRPDGKRNYGPVCGNPTSVGETVVAKAGYAIGAVTIKAGLPIDGIQLTYMEIGADGLNPNKSYLSKWLGTYGGVGSRTYLNDGRPIIGIAGMRNSQPQSPLLCLCLVTTPEGALADSEPPPLQIVPR